MTPTKDFGRSEGVRLRDLGLTSHSTMSRRMILPIVVALAINIVLVVVGRGSILLAVGLIPLIGIALISLCFGSVVLLFAGASLDRRWLATNAIALGFVAGSCFISLPLGLLVNRYDIEQAKGYCDRVRLKLERQRKATGRYPEDLSQVSDETDLPRLLKGSEFYHSNGGSYSFRFIDRSGLFNGVEYGSDIGVWNEWD